MELLFVLFVLNIWDVRVDKERIAGEVALKKQLLLFLQVNWLQLLETGGEVSFLLIFLCILWLLRFGLLFVFVGRFTFLFFLDFLLDFLFDCAQLLFLTCFVMDNGRWCVRIVLAKRFGIVRTNFDFICRVRSPRDCGLFVPIQYNWIDDH